MKKRRRKQIIVRFLTTFGFFLFSGALILTIFNLGQDRMARQHSEKALENLLRIMPHIADADDLEYGHIGFPDDHQDPLIYTIGDTDHSKDFIGLTMPVKEVSGNLYAGVLSIPSIGLQLPVMSNWSYDKLKLSPCLFAGSIYDRNAVIAAHNYRSHFGRLIDLSPGDRILFTDIEGNVFFYKVEVCEILQPTAITEMTSGEFELSLFTCTIGGKTRYTVRCSIQGVKLFTNPNQKGETENE